MTPSDIRAAIAADPALTALLPDSQAIADAMSVGRARPTDREIGVGMILATIGLASGNALLDALYSTPEFRHIRPLLEQGRLVVSSPLVADALAALVAGEVITQADADALIALGQEPDPVSEMDARRAIWADDGSRAI
ncbi:MAG: hypothetical protein LT106_18615 [Burkholderiaceae bacterium]|nr:hypothetical protein [Burkholderiaceae bacterium]